MTVALALAGVACTGSAGWAGDEFLSLCYHDIPVKASGDPYAVEVKTLVDELEYLKMHGYTFISVDDVLAAGKKERPLPAKPVLLTFDDGYESFYSNVVHVLELYHCPAVLDICSSWVNGNGPADIKDRMLSWEHVRELAGNPLVTLASHSHDLHHAVVYNPQGNTGHAAISRMYFSETGRYETEEAYRARIRTDLEASAEILTQKTGRKPSVIVWPYGAYNETCVEEARRVGLTTMFSLGERGCNATNTVDMDRWMVVENPKSPDFIAEILHRTPPQHLRLAQERVVQADLDLIYAPSDAETEKNLGRFLDRMVAIQPTTIYLQGCADPTGDGSVKAAYFPNRVLPVRRDLLSRVANQLYIRGFKIFVCMPVLSIVPPGRLAAGAEYTRSSAADETGFFDRGYRRLSPFSARNIELMSMLYEDLSAHVKLHGVVFGDDAYLLNTEDFALSAVSLRKACAGASDPAVWARLKAEKLDAFMAALKGAVRKNRPNAVFARCMGASALLDPDALMRHAQDYSSALTKYDYVVLNAYPEVQDVWAPEAWLEKLVGTCRACPGGLERTVFRLQAYDWDKSRWISGDDMVRRVRRLVAAGANHVAYYPDDFAADGPALSKIRLEMSALSKLFPKAPQPKTNVTSQY